MMPELINGLNLIMIFNNKLITKGYTASQRLNALTIETMKFVKVIF